MLKATKVRLYPTAGQRKALTFGRGATARGHGDAISRPMKREIDRGASRKTINPSL